MRELPPVVRNEAMYCPHCCSVTSQQLVSVLPYTQEWWAPDGAAIRELGCTYIATCEQCGGPFLYDNLGDTHDAKHFQEGQLDYPDLVWRHHSVPGTVREAYEAAVRLRATSPQAFVDKAFTALHALCGERGGRGHGLADRLMDLARRGALPKALADAANDVIAIGDGRPVNKYHEWVLDTFVRLLIEHTYVAPSRLMEFVHSVVAAKDR